MLHGYGESSSVAPYGPAVLRLAVAAVFIAHGAQKLFGIWGGGGLDGTAAYFAQLGLQPAYPLAVGVGILEFGGGLLLLLGAYTLVTAFLLAGDMAVAIWKVHAAGGFFLNWNLVPGQVHGYEFNLTLIAALICLMLAGPGAFSVDARRASHAAAEAAGRARLRAGKV
ncbi:MAG TPA: DoxX family protein [Vicinamibacterales bacterium]|nr:DoxX family protein [Vicinamibacterales bacterium]